MSFHTIEGLSEAERQLRPNVREFRGDGTPYLKVPGLLKLAEGDGAVRVGDLELPATYTYQVPLDGSERPQMETRTEPMVILRNAPDGTPILLRNRHSNEGMWQDGVAVYVDGEWAPDAPSEASVALQEVQRLREADETRRREEADAKAKADAEKAKKGA